MECLISVLDKAVNQVTVVDNGVNDDTDCVCRSEMRKHPDCRYNVGCGSTLTYILRARARSRKGYSMNLDGS